MRPGGMVRHAPPAVPAPSFATPEPCLATGDLRLPAVCQQMRQLKSMMQDGVQAFQPPKRMTVDEPVVVAYSLGSVSDAGQIVATAGAARLTGTIRISSSMYARLTGSGAVEIAPLTSEVQSLQENATPLWRWKVTPRRPGECPVTCLRLVLTSGVELRAGGETVRQGRSLPAVEIDVDSTYAYRWQRFWAGVQASALVPLGALTALAALAAALVKLWQAIQPLRARTPANQAPSSPGGETGADHAG